MADGTAPPRGPRIHFDPTINLGHIATGFVFLCSTMAAWFALNARVDKLGESIGRVDRTLELKVDKDTLARAELDLSRRIVETQQQQNGATTRIDEGFREIKVLLRDLDQKLDHKQDKPGR